jgi:hypothetical protein
MLTMRLAVRLGSRAHGRRELPDVYYYRAVASYILLQPSEKVQRFHAEVDILPTYHGRSLKSFIPCSIAAQWEWGSKSILCCLSTRQMRSSQSADPSTITHLGLESSFCYPLHYLPRCFSSLLGLSIKFRTAIRYLSSFEIW